MTAGAESIDLLLVTSLGSDTDYNQVLSLVANNGTCVVSPAREARAVEPWIVDNTPYPAHGLADRRSQMAGDMLDFAAGHNVRPWVERMPMSDANAAVKRMMEGKSHYRIVIYTDAAKEL